MPEKNPLQAVHVVLHSSISQLFRHDRLTGHVAQGDRDTGMEKKEARIKCSGCGTSFKVKVPVTDKPVSFKCKKCGKVLKLKLKPAAQPPDPSEDSPGQPTGFEPTHLFDVDAYHREMAQSKDHSPSVVEHLFLDAPPEAPLGPADKGRRWIVLSADIIRGPFTDPEIVKMIQSREITADMSLRLGERPWIKACDVADFRQLFAAAAGGSQTGAAGASTWEEGADQGDQAGEGHPPFYEQIPELLAYPVSGTKLFPLLVFTGIAFALSTLLSWDFLLGLPVNILGWVILYGYLFEVLRTSREKPGQPPPQWNLSAGSEFLMEGLKVLALLLVYSMIPVTICLLLMIAFFLNSLEVLGYVFMGITVLTYAASLLAVPAGLVVLASSGMLGSALNPSRIIMVVKKGGRAYWMLTAVSVGVGLVCMIAAIAGVFLVEIPIAGFVVAGLVMAVLLSYGNLVWFHCIGRFSLEQRQQMKQVVAG
jgi:hypothetical protein